MPNIRIDLDCPIVNGQSLTFKSPADCSAVTGLIVYYPEGESTSSHTFQFADAHGNNVGSVSLFAEDVLVKIILDTELGRAYVQNADTNAYLEGKFNSMKSYVDSKKVATTATLSASSWSDKQQTVNVSGVTTSNNILVTAAPASFVAYSEAMVYCSAQGDSTLTFTCDEVPTVDLNVNILIMN